MVFDESNQNIGFYSRAKLIRFTNESLQPPKSYEDGSNPGKPPLINPDKGGKKPPLINPDEGNKEPLILDSGDKENEGGYRPPTLIDPGKSGTVIPQEEEGLVFVGWLGFRYYRRKKYSDPTYYYKVTDEMFNEGTPLNNISSYNKTLFIKLIQYIINIYFSEINSLLLGVRYYIGGASHLQGVYIDIRVSHL